MDITGKIIYVGPQRSGTSASSGKPWACQDYVVEDASHRFPTRVCFTVFGDDRLRQFNIQLGETVSASFDIDAREYNGRWFNSIQAFAVTRPQTAPQQPAAFAPQPMTAPAAQRGAVFMAQSAPPPSQPDLPF